MESIFAHLDINPVDLLWHSLNFGLVLLGLWWLFFRPIARLLQERERRVGESLRQAEEIERLKDQTDTERRELLTSAHREAAAIRARAEGQVRILLVRTRAEAREEADRILERAMQLEAARMEGLNGLGHGVPPPNAAGASVHGTAG